jgi:hypothetical protein
VRAVLHDWLDEKAKQLLENTRDAMVKGYSRLFVYDIVLPPTGASISQPTNGREHDVAAVGVQADSGGGRIC